MDANQTLSTNRAGLRAAAARDRRLAAADAETVQMVVEQPSQLVVRADISHYERASIATAVMQEVAAFDYAYAREQADRFEQTGRGCPDVWQRMADDSARMARRLLVRGEPTLAKHEYVDPVEAA